MSDDGFTGSHHTEGVLAANEFYLYADFVEHVAILKENVCVQTTHHVKLATLTPDRATFHQAVVSESDVVSDIDRIHSAGLVFVE